MKQNVSIKHTYLSIYKSTYVCTLGNTITQYNGKKRFTQCNY